MTCKIHSALLLQVNLTVRNSVCVQKRKKRKEKRNSGCVLVVYKPSRGKGTFGQQAAKTMAGKKGVMFIKPHLGWMMGVEGRLECVALQVHTKEKGTGRCRGQKIWLKVW